MGSLLNDGGNATICLQLLFQQFAEGQKLYPKVHINFLLRSGCCTLRLCQAPWGPRCLVSWTGSNRICRLPQISESTTLNRLGRIVTLLYHCSNNPAAEVLWKTMLHLLHWAFRARKSSTKGFVNVLIDLDNISLLVSLGCFLQWSGRENNYAYDSLTAININYILH